MVGVDDTVFNKMKAARDMLLPGLRGREGTECLLDICLDRPNGCLRFTGIKVNPKTGDPIGRSIERSIGAAEVVDGSYKSKFVPLVESMKRELSGCQGQPESALPA